MIDLFLQLHFIIRVFKCFVFLMGYAVFSDRSDAFVKLVIRCV